jgi:hypothetical protein
MVAEQGAIEGAGVSINEGAGLIESFWGERHINTFRQGRRSQASRVRSAISQRIRRLARIRSRSSRVKTPAS